MYTNDSSLPPEVEYDDRDSSIIYSKSWSPVNGRPYSIKNNTGMALNGNNGEFFEFSFQGDAVSFYGEGNRDQGDIDFYIDDVYYSTASAYTDGHAFSFMVQAITGLSNDVPHRLKCVKKSGNWMVLDMLKVYNDNSADIAFDMQTTGGNNKATLVLSFDQALDVESATNINHYTLDQGAQVTQLFISLDNKQITLSVSGLTYGQSYQITLNDIFNEIKTKQLSQKVFSFNYDALAPEQVFDDVDPAIVYLPEEYWWSSDHPASIFNKTCTITGHNDAYFTLNFTGTGVAFYGQKNSDQGDVEFFIDDISQGIISTASDSLEQSSILFSKNDLPFGEHTIKGVKKSGTWMLIDALKVYNPGSIQIVSAATDEKNNMVIYFNQAVDKASAENIHNYVIAGGATIETLTLNDQQDTLTLACSDLTQGTVYHLKLMNISNQPLTQTADILAVEVTHYDGMVAWYALDDIAEGQAVDRVSGNNSATINGDVSTIEGKSNSAALFGPAGGYIDIGTRDTLQQQAFTVEAWIYPYDLSTQSMILAQEESGDPTRQWRLYCKNNQLYFAIADDTHSETVSFNTTSYIPANSWTHVALVRDNDLFKLALNGHTVMSKSSDIVQTNDRPIYIGARRFPGNPDGGDYFNGRIDEVKLYGYAVSDDRLVEHYRELADENFTLSVTNGEAVATFVHTQDSVPLQEDFHAWVKINDEIKVGIPLTSFSFDIQKQQATLTFDAIPSAAVVQNITFTLEYLELPTKVVIALKATDIASPVFTNLALDGELKTREVLTVTGQFSDTNSYVESGSLYQWGYSDTADGEFTLIQGVTTPSLMLLPEHLNKYIKISVTPRNERFAMGETVSFVTTSPVTQQQGNPRTDWFRDAKYGISNHFLPNYQNLSPAIPPEEHWQPGETWDDFLSTFNVETYAQAVADTGAGFVLLTIDQHSGYNLAPSAIYDSILDIEPGVRSPSQRDLPMEIAKELAKYNIKLMLYFMGFLPGKASLEYYDDDSDPHSPDRWGDLQATRLFEGEPFNSVRTQEGVRMHAAVVKSFNMHYGDLVAGYWFDGLYGNDLNDLSQPYNINTLIDATRAGNPQRIISAAGLDGSVYMDYVHGESGGHPDPDLNNNYVMDLDTYVPATRWANTDQTHQWFCWIPLGDVTINAGWGVPGSEADSHHYDTNSLAVWVKTASDAGGVIGLDVRVNRFGELDPFISTQLAAVKAAVYPEYDDEQLLDLVQQQTFRYFWDFANPTSGVAYERVPRDGTPATDSAGAIGGTGFGVMSIIVAIERGFITRDEGYQRLNMLIDFLGGPAIRYKGAWPHWINGETGATIPFSQDDNGADLVETAYMIQGLLTVRQYFNDDVLTAKINALWHDIDWNYFTNGTDSLYWHIDKNLEFPLTLTVTGWNEAMIAYILAIASPTHPVDVSLWKSGWSQGSYNNKNKEYYGITLPIGPNLGGSMTFAQYSFQGFDPRNLRDTANDVNYFEQNQAQAQIQVAYSVDNPKGFVGYGEDCWGLCPSDGPSGYIDHEPAIDDGTIAPSAALGSFPWAPEQSMAALRYFYDQPGNQLWTEKAGFVDAFNESQKWTATEYLAIDQGVIINMIENHRSGLLWQLFMSCPEIQDALIRIGFVSDPVPDV